MFNFVLAILVITMFSALFGAFCSFMDWADKEGRVPFFVLWYKKWSLRKGKRDAALAKMKVRAERKAA